MQYGPSGGAVRVVIASDAPQAVAELDKLAGYADQVSLVGFIRHPYELDEDLEALRPDVVLLYTGFGGLDTVGLAAYLASRSARLRVMVVVDPSEVQFIRRVEDAGAATVRADADPPSLVGAILGAAATGGPPADLGGTAEPVAWPGAVWPGLETAGPAAMELQGGATGRPAPGGPSSAEPPPAVPEPAPSVPQPAVWGMPVAADAAATQGGWEGWPGGGPSSPPDLAGPAVWEDQPAAQPPGGPASEPSQGWEAGPVPEEPALPASVPVFRLDSTAFEPVPAPDPPAADQWPGVPVAPPVEPPVPAEPDPEPVRPVRPRPPRRPGRGRAEVVVVFSGKGGVGTSLVATNLAVALAAEQERVALIDLDLQFGDVAVMLHAEGHPTAIDALAQQGEQVDIEFIEEVMAPGPEGVRALLAPASPEFADLVNTASLRAILRELAKTYDHIVVDTPSHLEERNLEAIEMASQIIVVTSFSFAAIKDTKVTLKLLQSLGVDRDSICVVLNQTRAKASFQRAEVEDSLRFRVLTVLPFEPKVDDYFDNGQQIVTADPKAEFSKQFRVLVDHVMGGGEGTGPKETESTKGRAARRRFSLGRS
jgi:MinD-like ATPase involved in chromosome partitioning or flagellar assembly